MPPAERKDTYKELLREVLSWGEDVQDHDKLIALYVLRSALFSVELVTLDPENELDRDDLKFMKMDAEFKRIASSLLHIDRGTRGGKTRNRKKDRKFMANDPKPTKKDESKTWAQRDAELRVQGGEINIM